jgi:chromosomal replication initiator protein
VRELEGALNRVVACSTLYAEPIDLALARRALGPLLKEERKLTIELIQKSVASYFSVKVADLKGARRHRAVSGPRQLAMFICRKHTGHSFPEIGERFGNRDHSTVIAAVSKMEKQLPDDPELRKAVKDIETHLGLQ